MAILESGIGRFVVRVYGIWQRDDAVLLMREGTGAHRFTKFPGGGLKPGEGLADCLRREFREELNAVPEAMELFYVNDDFVRSAFDPADQLISVYYRVACSGAADLSAHTVTKWGKPYHLQGFWQSLDSLEPEQLSFPIDQQVALRLKDGS